MTESLRVRRFLPGEEPLLHEIFFSAVHLVASRDYNPEQVDAWAPRVFDATSWQVRIRGLNPFVAVLADEPVGYADVQPSGYIDHFYVSGRHPRQGIGTHLMRRILVEAASLRLLVLTSDVSRTAQPLFEKFGFTIVEQRYPTVRGVVTPNARMSRIME